MLASLALISISQASPPAGFAYANVTPQIAAARVARCGAGSVTVRTDPDLEEDILVLAANGPVSDGQIACIEKAASFYDVELPPAAQPRFNAIRDARAKVMLTAQSHDWLASHELLDRLPVYEKGKTDDAEFADQVEALCNAKGAVHSRYGVHALSPDWVMKQRNHLDEEAFGCVMYVSWAAGFELHFIGNEAVAPEQGDPGDRQ